MAPSTPRGGPHPPADLATLLFPVRAVAFWAAIVLPFLSLALVATGHAVTLESFGSLVAANAAAFLLGHDYRR